MSRLYYEESKPKLKGGAKDSGANIKEYLEKVAKIIPSEIIAGYLTLMGLVPLIKDNALHKWFYYGIFALGAAFTPYYFWLQAEKGKPKAIHIFLSSVSFVVWAYQTTGDKVFPHYDGAIASIVLIVFSLATVKIPLN